jgi:DNA integrity scanning protein DisA with diadenylate cyclase activity
MSEGFNNKLKVEINTNEVDKLLKEYKKIKKYMKSPLYEVKKIDGTEKVVSKLLKEYEDNPLD